MGDPARNRSPGLKKRALYPAPDFFRMVATGGGTASSRKHPWPFQINTSTAAQAAVVRQHIVLNDYLRILKKCRLRAKFGTALAVLPGVPAVPERGDQVFPLRLFRKDQKVIS